MNDDFGADDEILRRASHLILDLVSAVDVDASSELPLGWAQETANQLAQIGAITMLVDDETRQRRIDITPLMGAVAGLLEILVRGMAERTGVDRLAVIGTMRQAVDET